MSRRILFALLLLLIFGGALALRLPDLPNRPMHTDEAVQAIKFQELLEHGRYTYDAHEYHGPVLNYVTLPFVKKPFAETDEATFRRITVAFGVGLILLLFLISDGLGKPETIVAGLLTALSPAMVFYSRYYIHEMLLVFFTFAAIGSGWRYLQTDLRRWAITCGISLGLMHATKETCVIAWAAMGAGIVGTLLLRRLRGEPLAIREWLRPRALTLAAALGWGVFASVLLFSSFFSNMRGPIDSVMTYFTYVNRASGETHNHPAWWYLWLLGWFRYGPGPVWSEGLILVLSLFGSVAAFVRVNNSEDETPHTGSPTAARATRQLLTFLAIYTLAMLVVYSAIPYKTPWCMLGFLHGMILLAGIGAVWLIRALPNLPLRAIAVLLMLAGTAHLTRQTYRASYVFESDPRNPYVYAQTSPDMLRMAKDIKALRILGDAKFGIKPYVQLFAKDAWPLPWLLRDRSVDEWNSTEIERNMEVIITDRERIELIGYQLNIYGQRPGVFLYLYIRKDIWDKYLESRR